jgi:hypothetical protein
MGIDLRQQESGLSIGTTQIKNGTVGRVLFEGTGNVTQEDAGFLFDATNKTLTNYGKGAQASNTSFGLSVLGGNTTGDFNTAIGRSTMGNAYTGSYNSAFGYAALSNVTAGYFTGAGNIAMGYYAGAYITSGSYNTVFGYSAGNISTGSYNTIIGTGQLSGGTVSNNVILSDGQANIALWKNSSNLIGIGYNSASDTLGAKLDVKAQGALSTDIAFRVRDSGNTNNLFKINGRGEVEIASETSQTFLTLSQAYLGVNYPRFKFALNGYNVPFSLFTFDNTVDPNLGAKYLNIYNDVSGDDKCFFQIKNNNFGIGGDIVPMSTADRKVLYLSNGTAPTTGTTDGVKMYSADIVAGNAAPHFRTENGSVIKLYQQSSAGITTVGDLVTVLQNLGLLS